MCRSWFHRALFYAAVFIGVFGTGSPSTADDGCDAPLKNGVFDKLELRRNSYSNMVLAWQFSQMTAQEARRRIQAGATVPIDGFPVGGNFDDNQFDSWKQSVQHSLQSATTN